MSQKRRFRAAIEDAGGGGAFVTVPFNVEQVFGKKRVKVRATIDGEPYRGSLVRMGGPCHLLPVLKGIREKVGKSVGELVSVVVEEDTEPRVVTVPPDLKATFKADAKARTLFTGLSYTHQKEYVRWIEEAKREQTRSDRIARTVEMIKQGKTGR